MQRETKYTNAVRECLRRYGHATNAQLAEAVRYDFPLVSDTTIHRVTQRLHERGEVGIAPKADDGSLRYDHNNMFHDHFVCQDCGTLRDVVIPIDMRRQLEKNVEGCCLNGNLLIMGDCKKCKEKL